MDESIIRYIKANTFKKCGRKDFTDDIIQEVLMKCLENGITELVGNEITLYRWIIYHLNKENRMGKKLEELRQEQWEVFLDKVFLPQMLIDEFNKFAMASEIDGSSLQQFYDVKFERKTYKELGIDSVKDRVKIRRILSKFAHYIRNKGLMIEDFWKQ